MSKSEMEGGGGRVFPVSHNNDSGFYLKSEGKFRVFRTEEGHSLISGKDHAGRCVIKALGSKGRRRN